MDDFEPGGITNPLLNLSNMITGKESNYNIKFNLRDPIL